MTHCEHIEVKDGICIDCGERIDVVEEEKVTDLEFVGNDKCDYPNCGLCYPGTRPDGKVLGKNQHPDVLTGRVPVSGNRPEEG